MTEASFEAHAQHRVDGSRRVTVYLANVPLATFDFSSRSVLSDVEMELSALRGYARALVDVMSASLPPNG